MIYRSCTQNLIGNVAVQPNTTSVWLYLFSSNGIKILLALPENESGQKTPVYCLANSVVFAQENEL
jgi:hypothetical protein